METVDKLINTLRTTRFEERPPIKTQLLALATSKNSAMVREHLDNVKRGELLEIQWEIDDVLAESAPPPVNPPAETTEQPEPEPDSVQEGDPNAQLSAADLDMVYDDPRGFKLHKSKEGERWFATQVDPSTGTPQTFELHPHELTQLKSQLQGSPYWRIGG
jgi:hypothetical protein